MAADKTGVDQLHAMWFAAATAAFLACVERAVVVSLFTHWRVWAFLALNLLLLAILFTSKSQIKSLREDDEEEVIPVVLAAVGGGGEELTTVVAGGGESVKMAASGGEKKVKEEQISEEELNKRVEAFIAMFRQHLVSDAKNFRTRGHGFSQSAKVY